VVVALLGALAALRSEHPSAHRVAYEAHHLEVDVLGRQSGIQDHLSAAYGGMIFLEVDQYPRATVTRLPLWAALGDLLSLVYLGRAHDSSAVHRDVIAGAASRGATLFSALRAAAVASCEAVRARDLAAFGRAMIANTDAQDALHPSLVGADARRVIRTATAGGALGWKVNGAGGDGGSVTVLSPSPQAKQAFERQVTATARWRVLPFRVSPGGLHVEGALP
jgi:D-glycero-alpha-D-manno-heptose-7-phosphate kinase